PSVRAVLGHWLFGYVHPYSDGNGRMARFLMNAMLASGGYPWTVIRIVDRKSYLSALDRASIEMDIHPFTTFIVRRVQWRLERHDLKFPAPKESFDLGRDMVFILRTRWRNVGAVRHQQGSPGRSFPWRRQGQTQGIQSEPPAHRAGGTAEISCWRH